MAVTTGRGRPRPAGTRGRLAVSRPEIFEVARTRHGGARNGALCRRVSPSAEENETEKTPMRQRQKSQRAAAPLALSLAVDTGAGVTIVDQSANTPASRGQRDIVIRR
jgi:hypothetical protein